MIGLVLVTHGRLAVEFRAALEHVVGPQNQIEAVTIGPDGAFSGVKAGTYMPGNGCPDGIHYDVKGNLWVAAGRLGGMIEVDPRGVIVGFVPIPNGDLATTNFAFGGPDNQYIYFEGAISGTFWRFKAPYPGLVGPGGVRLPAQP